MEFGVPFAKWGVAPMDPKIWLGEPASSQATAAPHLRLAAAPSLSEALAAAALDLLQDLGEEQGGKHRWDEAPRWRRERNRARETG